MDQTFRSRLPILILICSTQFMIPFDYMSMALALISIRDDLGMSPAMTPWIMSSYLLTFGGLLLLGGKLADLYGRRRLLIIGLLVFSFFSVSTALTTSPTFFLAARTGKGIGSALICPAMLAMLNLTFPGAGERHRALAVYWFFSVLGSVTGTGVGGFLTDYSWRATLLVNVPLGLFIALIAPRILPRDVIGGGDRKLDYGGAVLSTLGIGAAIFAITNAMWFGLTPATTIAILVSIVCLAGLFKLEQVHSSPLMPPRLFRIRNFIGANIFNFFWAAANSKYLLARVLQEVQHYTPGQAGLALVPHSIVGLSSVFVAVRLIDRFGALKAMLIGAAIEGAGILIFCAIAPETSYLTVLFGLVMLALGVTVAGISVKLPACWDAEDRDQGVASGMIFATQQLANAFAIPIYSAVLGLAMGWYAASAPDQALSYGYRFAFGMSLLFIVIGSIAAIIFIRTRLSEHEPPRKQVASDEADVLRVER